MLGLVWKNWLILIEVKIMRQRGEIVIAKAPKTKGLRRLSKGLRRLQMALIKDSKGSKGFVHVFERKDKKI